VPGFPVPRSDPANIAVGERLFLETRFAQSFHARSGGEVNATLPAGDPVMDLSRTTGSPLPGPFAGFAMNCRACHLVNEFRESGRGNRTYADYARRPAVPARPDGKQVAARNAPAMVNATIPRAGGYFLHFDGEFGSNEDLVKATLTGRNYGWLPEEGATAARHVARVIREDDGRGPLAREFGGFSYREVFLGQNPALGEETERFRLTEPYRLDVSQATDDEVLHGVARLISVYMDSLFFSRDETSEYDSSPYDAFLETNRIPRRPSPGMSVSYYLRDVADHLATLKDPIYVSPTNGFNFPQIGRFKTLTQEFRFGPRELEGMRIFFNTPKVARAAGRPADVGVGNCVACHAAPHFTDFKFHNTGVAQEEYDALHGAGAFARLEIPGLTERRSDPDRWLAPTAAHPRASGVFLDVPSVDRPGRTDLGLRNVFAHPDHPKVQASLRETLIGEGRPVDDATLLPRTIGLFKTPSLRGLAFSDPYLHNGSRDTLEDVVGFYRDMARQARAGKLRNGAPELLEIHLRESDIAPLAAFLRALNEDYE
jgi:cytochrome c peroxidase